MSTKSDKFSKALGKLIKDGDMLHMSMQLDCFNEEFVEEMKKTFGEEEAIKYLKNLPDFKESYQGWYSEAQAVVRQILPDRVSDFQSYYEFPRVRKDIASENYMIRDYLQGLCITRGYDNKIIVEGRHAIPDFVQQLNVVKAARDKLDSALIDLTAILQADLFDSEIASARALAKAGYFRATGAICGVVIEKHLLQVCNVHSITLRKKNLGISDLNQALRDNDTITVPQWRFIQHLADIRNICDHAKGREPTKEEIEDLLLGTEKVLKTVF